MQGQAAHLSHSLISHWDKLFVCILHQTGQHKRVQAGMPIVSCSKLYISTLYVHDLYARVCSGSTVCMALADQQYLAAACVSLVYFVMLCSSCSMHAWMNTVQLLLRQVELSATAVCTKAPCADSTLQRRSC
jgi:hypothetical protein